MPGWFTILWGAACKSTVLIGVAWLLALALRRQSAAMRHLVWTAAAAGMLALPLLSVSMPAWRVRSSTLGPLVSTITFRTTAVARADSDGAAAATARPEQPATPGTHADVRFVVALLWAAGSFLALAHLAAAWLAMWRKRRLAARFGACALLAALRRALGIEREVALLEVPRGTMPLSFGVLHPAILLPADAREWSEERRRVVLLHELAHIRRGDLATQLMARVAVAIFWWNPLAWKVWREFVKERERAADDLVLTAGERATAYASQLLEIARSMQAAPALVSAAAAIARPSQLEGRLMAILDGNTNRKSLSSRALLAATVLTVALVAPFAALQAQDRPAAVAEPNLDATIQSAVAQTNYEILDNAAASFLRARKYDEAQKLLEMGLTLRAKSSGESSTAYAEGLMKLGDLAARRGKGADAVSFYTEAVALGDTPTTVPGLIFLASNALGKKDPVTAESFIDRALAVTPSGTEAGRALTVKGNIAVANGLDGVAELQYLQALAQDPPRSPEAALTMESYARLLTSEDRQGEADALLAQALPIRQAQVEKISTHAAATVTEGAVKVGRDVAPPRLASKQEPEYSEDARSTKLQGTVLLSITVGTDGEAHDFKLLHSLGFGLDEKAAEAVSEWRFKPGTRDGAPVPVQATIEVNFRLL
ncbi:MAG TPA: TonB family protein [Bryobacteraceae bacterium]|nr:TonB family protein [Bryobacteraceae bacterium]